jgi:hypothetical protein
MFKSFTASLFQAALLLVSMFHRFAVSRPVGCFNVSSLCCFTPCGLFQCFIASLFHARWAVSMFKSLK